MEQAFSARAIEVEGGKKAADKKDEDRQGCTGKKGEKKADNERI